MYIQHTNFRFKHLLICLSALICLAFAANTNQAQSFVEGPFIAWHPDGNMLAVAQETSVQIIDVDTIMTLNTITNIEVSNNGSVWSQDGTMLAIVDGTDVQVWSQPWDANLAQLVATFQYYSDWDVPPPFPIFSIAWSPDSARIAAASGDHTWIWNVTTQEIEHTIHGEWRIVTSLIWTSDNRLALSSNDSVVAIINPATGEPITQYYRSSSGFPVAFTALAFSPDGDQAAFGDQDGTILIWDNTRITDLWVYNGVDAIGDVSTSHVAAVRSLSWHPDGRFLASGGWDGTVRIWDTETRELLEIIEVGEDFEVNSVAWSPDGSQLAYATPTGYEIIPAPQSTSPVYIGRIAFSGDLDGDWEIFTINSDGSDLQQLTFNADDDSYPAWSPDGRQIVYVHDGDLYTMNADGTSQHLLLETSQGRDPKWSPDGTRLVFEQNSDRFTDIFVLDLLTMTLTNITNTPDELDGSPTWSPDGSKIAFASTGDHPVPRPIDGDPFLDIFTINPDGTDRTEITVSYAALGDLNWTRNNRFFFSARYVTVSVFSVSADGGEIMRIGDPDHSSYTPDLSPKEDKIVFVQRSQLAIMNTDGSNLTIITDPSFKVLYPSW